MAESNFLSREELLAGRLSTERRSTRVLGTIEARVSHMRSETRQAVRAIFSGREDEFRRTFGDDYLRSLQMSARFANPPTLADIERFSHQWRALVPDEPEVQAGLIRALMDRYHASPAAAPDTLEAAGYGSTAVEEAFRRLFKAPLDASTFSATHGQVTQPPTAPATDPEEQARANAEAALEWMSVPAGTVLMREGDEPDYLYFIVSGRLRISTGTGADARLVADLGRGELVGEIGVLTGERRTATATAMRDSEVVRLPQAEVLRMAYQSPQMLLRVNHILAQRLRVELSSKRRVTAQQLTIAIIGLTPDAPLKQLAAELAESIGRTGPVSHVSRDRAEREFPRLTAGIDPSEDGELLAWLSEQETRNQTVIFEADAGPGMWTDLCIRQADRVALVSPAGDPPPVTAIEERVALLNPAARRELVLLHQPGVRPRGTRKWIESREFAAHHHAVLTDRTLIDRLARRLTGQAVGLVLGGGGVRGYAHIGVWRAIEEAGIPIDMVGGTSVGAMMGAGMAIDRSGAELEALGRSFASEGITDLTLPMVSFFASAALTRLLRRHTEDVRIEDLARPFFCVSTSLTRSEPVLHTTGPLWRAVRASSAIPGLYAPMLGPDGDLLVDGGIMNNVPVDIMRGFCERGPVIAVNLSIPNDPTVTYDFPASLSGWRVLWSRLNPFAKSIKAPSIFTTLLRTTEAGSVHRLRTGEVLRMADLIIQPPLEQMRLLEFRNVDGLMRAGYEAGLEAVNQWLAENPDLAAQLRR